MYIFKYVDVSCGMDGIYPELSTRYSVNKKIYPALQNRLEKKEEI